MRHTPWYVSVLFAPPTSGVLTAAGERPAAAGLCPCGERKPEGGPRKAEDGRACRLRLTATGHRAVAATRNARRGLVRELLNAWPAEDRRSLAALLERLNAGLDARLAGAQTGDPPPLAQGQTHVSV